MCSHAPLVGLREMSRLLGYGSRNLLCRFWLRDNTYVVKALPCKLDRDERVCRVPCNPRRAARTQAKIHFLINDHQPELRPVFLCSLIYRQNFERRLFRKRLPALHMSRHGEKIETGKDNY